MTKSTEMVNFNGLMEGNIMASGKMEGSMELGFIQQMGYQDKAFGKMVSVQNGLKININYIMNDKIIILLFNLNIIHLS